MKLLRIVLISMMVFGLFSLTATPTKAQAFAQYVSGVTMQNLTGSDVTVTATYFNQDGSQAGSTTDTITGNGVKDYASVPITSGFNGSLVLSSNGAIGAVSTLRGDNKGRDAYVGASTGATTVNLPILMKNWGSSAWNTWFAVQNTGTGDASVTVKYAPCSSPTAAVTIKPSAMATFHQDTEGCLTGSKVLTSATVSSSQPVAIVVAQESKVVNSLLISSGFGVGDTQPVLPLINVNNPTTTGWRTAISIFNQGTQSSDVTLTYTKASDGTTCTETHAVPNQQAVVFGGNNFILGATGLTCPVGATLIGSAYVSANSTNQPLVAVANQDRGGLASAYNSFSVSAATPKVFFPQIQDRNGLTNQWASSIMVMNVGAGSTYVKCTFANSSYAPTSGQLGSYRSWENLQRGQIASGYVGSGSCTAYTSSAYTTVDTSAKIVAVVNIRGTGNNYDLMMTYDGLNGNP